MKKIFFFFAAISVVFLGAAHCVLAQGIQFTKTTLAVGSGPSFVLPADLLGTGLPDLICPNFGFRYGCLGDYGGDSSNLTFWINNGQGGFSSSATIQVGDPDLQASLQPEPVCLAAADFNGTGKLDLVVENFYYNTLGIYTNAVTGFKEAKGLSSFGRQPIYITTADVNGDGKPDILTVNNFDQDNNLSIITNGGNYNFDIGTNLPVGSGPVYLAVGDFNGDGKPDLACANYGYCGDGNTLTIYTNAGQGHFSLASTPTVGYGPTCVVAADVNGDGRST